MRALTLLFLLVLAVQEAIGRHLRLIAERANLPVAQAANIAADLRPSPVSAPAKAMKPPARSPDAEIGSQLAVLNGVVMIQLLQPASLHRQIRARGGDGRSHSCAFAPCR